MGFGEKIFGTYSERELKRIKPLVAQIEALRPQMLELSQEEMRARTRELKERRKNGASLDDLLVEAFALVRESARRTIGLEHYPVQLMGGIILHQGRIAEMRTGEGKTLVATLPSFLNALDGEGVHVVTVNDYLAKRDAEWMGKIHEYLGLTVGCVLNSMTPEERQKVYPILGAEKVSEIFTYIEDVDKYIGELNIEKAAKVISHMDSDDAVDVLEEMDDSTSEKIMSMLEEESGRDVRLILSYDDDEIGSKMTTNLIVIKKGISVREAMRALVAQAGQNDNIYTIYVTDETPMGIFASNDIDNTYLGFNCKKSGVYTIVSRYKSAVTIRTKGVILVCFI